MGKLNKNKKKIIDPEKTFNYFLNNTGSLPSSLTGYYTSQGFVINLYPTVLLDETELLPVMVSYPVDKTGIPSEYLDTGFKITVISDLLYRLVSLELRNSRTSGFFFNPYKAGQPILERSALTIDGKHIHLGLMIQKNRGSDQDYKSFITYFQEEFLDQLGSIYSFNPMLERKFRKYLHIAEDMENLRLQLIDLGLVAFVAENSSLPRIGQFDDRPMNIPDSVTIQVPESLSVSVYLPHRGKITGIGIKEGICLVIGGGYHGKSTFIDAIQHGIYNHIPGDGRNFVVTIPETVRVNSERGRYISNVNISPFVGQLPFYNDTRQFSATNASGSTSQAASIMEALEMGAKLLLFDEDTCATNLLVRDLKMQEMVSKYKEPLTPLIDKIKWLHKDVKVSTMLALGGSGDYFEVADTVIFMDEYQPKDVTRLAKDIVIYHKEERRWEGGSEFGDITARIPLLGPMLKVLGPKKIVPSFKLLGQFQLKINYTVVQLNSFQQVAEPGQLIAAFYCLLFCRDHLVNNKRTLKKIITMLFNRINLKGLDIINYQNRNDLVIPRSFDVAALFNRVPGLEFIPGKNPG